jgi:hypothetical protein
VVEARGRAGGQRAAARAPPLLRRALPTHRSCCPQHAPRTLQSMPPKLPPAALCLPTHSGAALPAACGRSPGAVPSSMTCSLDTTCPSFSVFCAKLITLLGRSRPLNFTVENAAACASRGWLLACSTEYSCITPRASAGLGERKGQRAKVAGGGASTGAVASAAALPLARCAFSEQEQPPGLLSCAVLMIAVACEPPPIPTSALPVPRTSQAGRA